MERHSSLIRLDPNKVSGQAASHPDPEAEVLRVHSPWDSRAGSGWRLLVKALAIRGCLNFP